MFARPDNIPDAPGSYQFKDASGRIIYVGKAKSLRNRVASYFVRPSLLHPRTAQMMARAASVEWIQVDSEVDAIMLEFTLIRLHRPHFNVRLIDDKEYPWLAVTVAERFPRAMVARGTHRPGTRYFGPFAQATALRETLDLLLRTFPLRTCTDAKYRRYERLGRPCLLFHIERCAGPCVGEVTDEEYRGLVDGIMGFMEGDTKTITTKLAEAMTAAADAEEFEEAARLRDRLEAVRIAGQRQEMVASSNEELDVFGVEEDELLASVQVLYVRHGRVVGRNGFVLEKVEPLDAAGLSGRILEVHYGDSPRVVARTVVVGDMPDDVATYRAWLSGMRGRAVSIEAPSRGRKRRLRDTARRNAAEQLARHRTQRSSDLTTRAIALEELKRQLGLREAPLRIECYDMSHLQGTDYVGSMVVMEDGLLKRADYRRFRVRSVAGNDDYAAMREVLTRRLRRLDDADGRVRFAYPPQLLLLDGGKGQLGVGTDVLAELDLADRIEVAALAKQFEEVFVPGRSAPVRIPRDSHAIYLLQQLRDEAHRYAITYHRALRAKRMTRDALDGIPGLGPQRKRRLLAAFGSVRGVRAADRAELAALPWLPDVVAAAVYERLHAPRPAASS